MDDHLTVNNFFEGMAHIVNRFKPFCRQLFYFSALGLVFMSKQLLIKDAIKSNSFCNVSQSLIFPFYCKMGKKILNFQVNF